MPTINPFIHFNVLFAEGDIEFSFNEKSLGSYFGMFRDKY
ncbi:MAG: hypothetical protein RI965_1868 [Bacteroidota bacterium]|jgi:hypothetical protein